MHTQSQWKRANKHKLCKFFFFPHSIYVNVKRQHHEKKKSAFAGILGDFKGRFVQIQMYSRRLVATQRMALSIRFVHRDTTNGTKPFSANVYGNCNHKCNTHFLCLCHCFHLSLTRLLWWSALVCLPFDIYAECNATRSRLIISKYKHCR